MRLRTRPGKSGGRETRTGDPMPPPASCLIRSFANYRRKHRVNCYTRSASRPPLVRSVPLFQPSVCPSPPISSLSLSLSLSYTRSSFLILDATWMFLRRPLVEPRAIRRSVTWDHVSRHQKSHRAREESFSSTEKTVARLTILDRSQILVRGKSEVVVSVAVIEYSLISMRLILKYKSIRTSV